MLFFRGLIIGFSIAAPVGPIGMLCIKRTLSQGRMSGLITGLAAAAADALYGLLAASGIELLTSGLLTIAPALKLIGGLCLIYMGVSTMKEKAQTGSASSQNEKAPHCHRRCFASTFFLTLSNPMTILSFAAVLTSLTKTTLPPCSASGVAPAAAPMLDKLITVFGIFVGSCTWWIILSTTVALFKVTALSSMARFINRASGTTLIGFGLLSLLSL